MAGQSSNVRYRSACLIAMWSMISENTVDCCSLFAVLCFAALRRRVENWLAGPDGLAGGAVGWPAQAEAMEAGKYRRAREKSMKLRS